MKDTPPEVEEKLRELYMQRSGAERLKMASDMFDSARAMIRASMPPGLTPEEEWEFIFRRTYPELNLDDYR